jgi:serine/threonine protein kinase
MEKCPLCKNSNKDVKILKCKFCEKTFCSVTCLLKHSSYNLGNSDKNSIINSLKRRHSNKLSSLFPFITSGNFNEEPKFDQKYSFNNFSKVIKEIFPVLLGSGSFGNVYLVRHNITQEEYAMKVVDKKKLNQLYGNSYEQILNEIRIHSKLDHENIIHLYNVSEDEENIKIIMEYAQKGNLFDVIQKEKKGISEEKAYKYFIQIVNAVYYLHQHNIIHRDIKPENILISEDDTIKLCDFGWAKELTLENRKTFCGTAGYMAPEIVTSENYGFGVDIWSLGNLLYEMIFGHSPFEGNNMNSIMINIKTKDLTYDKPISKECKNLIEKMLESNQQKRFKITDIFEHEFIKKYTKKINGFINTENDLKRYKEIKNIKRRNFDVKKTFTFQNININIEDNIINLSKKNTKHIKKYINKRNSDNNLVGLREKPKKNQKSKNQIFIQNLKSSLISQLEKAKKNIENFTFIKNEKYTFEDFRDDEKMVKTFKNDDKIPKKHKIKSSKILRRDESSLIDTDEDLFICEQNISLSEKDIEENIETFSSSIDSCIDNSIIERLNKAYKKYGNK